MKRILLIWVGAIVLVIGVGILWGALTGTNEPTEQPKTEITYIDDNGNTVVGTVNDNKVHVTIDGKEYSYNSGVWKEQAFKVGKQTFEMSGKKHYIKNFFNAGWEETEPCLLKLDDDHYIYADYNTVYGYLFNVSVYASPFNNASGYVKYYCDDFVLPGNVKLGESTKEYVESIYGMSHESNFSNENLMSVKYYANSDRRGERLTLFYTKDTGILCGIEWAFDVR